MGFVNFLNDLGSGPQLRGLRRVADQVDLIEEDFQGMSDTELRRWTGAFKERPEGGEDLNWPVSEAFATVCEATVRMLNKRHFDAQIMGGTALHWGSIAEIKTGEGETLVGTLSSYLNALSGDGVHTVTTNDYLAKYQPKQMGWIHHFLGLEVGVILASMSPAERRTAYQADIICSIDNKFGFDCLRGNMTLNSEDLVQRGHHFAVVDEVDLILIDEAYTPLIISGPVQDTHEWYPAFAQMVCSMKHGQHYEMNEKKRTVTVLGVDIEAVEDRLGIDSLYESVNIPFINYLNNAIKAKEPFKWDKDYVVLDGEILVVDEHTGRTLARRRYNEGLHQTLEAKEGVEIEDEYQALATATLQNYLYTYDKPTGMTDTARTKEFEFQEIYDPEVIPVPANMPMICIDQCNWIYRTEEAKYKTIIEDVVPRHEDGQLVLIDIALVVRSELLFGMLKKEGIPHKILNAKRHEWETAVVVRAGRKGAVTVSISITGRGTDIVLGGNPEFLVDLQLCKQDLDPVGTLGEYEAQWPGILKALREQAKAEHDEVVEAGGPYVIDSERHESRCIDSQLRRRSGCQEDPNKSHFYLSPSDNLMRLFHPGVLERILIILKVPNDVLVDSRSASNAIELAQKQAENQSLEMRKNVLKYDDVVNRQRYVIYRDRHHAFDGVDLPEQLRSRTVEVVAVAARQHTAGIPEDWDLEMFFNGLKMPCPVGLDQEEIEEEIPTQKKLVEMFSDDVCRTYDERGETLGFETMRELERQVLLPMVDRNWREHLYEMDYLREGIGFRAMAWRDPLVEYQREGGDVFIIMQETLFERIIGMLFNPQVNQPEPVSVSVVTDTEGKPEDVLAKATAVSEGEAKPRHAELLTEGLDGKRERNLTYSAPDESGEATTNRGDGTKRPAREATTSGSGGGDRTTRRRKTRRKRWTPGACHECYGRRIG